MMRIVLVLVVSAMLSFGCAARRTVIPNPMIPHRVAADSDVTIWVRHPDGTLSKQKVLIVPGWWLASPYLIEQVEEEQKKSTTNLQSF